jgi:hypothetical protein
MSKPLRAGIIQFFGAPTLYLAGRLLSNPSDLLASPWEGMIRLVAVNLPVSIGVVFYVWFRKKSN